MGTVGAIVGSSLSPYFVTAGHALADIYAPGAGYPLGHGATWALGVRGETWTRMGAAIGQVAPSSPRLDGQVLDAVAIPLDGDVTEWRTLACRVPDFLECLAFAGRPGYVLVERDGEPARLPGVVEAVLASGTMRVQDRKGRLHSVHIPPHIWFRFDGSATSVPGDSGAPVIVESSSHRNLLGFHFYESGRRIGSPDFRTASVSTVASTALHAMGLDVIGGA